MKTEEDKSLEFYKEFYDKNRIPMLQYDSLREHFQKMITDVLGPDYYNMGMDVYECDRICCEHVASKIQNSLCNKVYAAYKEILRYLGNDAG